MQAQMQRQIQYIYNQLGADAEPEVDVASDVDDDDDDFEDSVDSEGEGEEGEAEPLEEDFNDTMKIEGVLTGEEWLTSNFLLSNNEAMAQSATISRKIDD